MLPHLHIIKVHLLVSEQYIEHVVRILRVLLLLKTIFLANSLLCTPNFCHDVPIRKLTVVTLSVALVRERTIPTERPPPVGEVSANFCG